MIVPINEKDEIILDKITKIHRENYPDDHISGHLSVKLVQKYYSYFFDDLSNIALFLDSSSDVRGFIVYGAEVPKKIGQFKSDNSVGILYFFISKPKLFVRFIIKKIIALFLRMDEFVESDFLVLSIVSDNSMKGVGSELIDNAFEYCIKNGIPSIGLYVACTNVKAINFYLRKKFLVVSYCKGQFYMQKTF